jgi:hypothetical protein
MPTLSDLDNLYKNTVSNLPIEQRLWYCSRHLDKLQLILLSNSGTIKEVHKDNLMEMLKALQDEIKILEQLK